MRLDRHGVTIGKVTFMVLSLVKTLTSYAEDQEALETT